MVAVRIYLKDERVGEKFVRIATRQRKWVLSATRAAAQDASDAIIDEGKADIASAGNFGPRWTEGLHAPVTEGGGNIRVGVTHDVPYFMVFERGAVIHGKPLLWIPLSHVTEAQGVRARDFPGRLFKVPKGPGALRKSGKAALLLSADDKQPKYFAKESVTIPKKFHIVQITRSVASRLAEFYRTRLKQEKGS
jgi:hypothetical protein